MTYSIEFVGQIAGLHDGVQLVEFERLSLSGGHSHRHDDARGRVEELTQQVLKTVEGILLSKIIDVTRTILNLSNRVI